MFLATGSFPTIKSISLVPMKSRDPLNPSLSLLCALPSRVSALEMVSEGERNRRLCLCVGCDTDPRSIVEAALLMVVVSMDVRSLDLPGIPSSFCDNMFTSKSLALASLCPDWAKDSSGSLRRFSRRFSVCSSF